MKILLIGGTGNISSEVASLLHNQGHSITVINTGTRPVPPQYKHIKADRTDSQQFKVSLSNASFDIVIDFFAFIPVHLRLVYDIFFDKIQQFIFISSATVYQKPHELFPITEKTPRENPFWPYAQDKIACEKYLESVNSSKFPVTIVRPSHTFGKTWIPSPLSGNDFTVAARILDGKPIFVHDGGKSLWTLTASSDFAAGLAGLVGNPKALGESFHITSDEILSWNQIYDTIGEVLGKKPLITCIPTEFLNKIYPESIGPLKGDKSENGVFDNSKIKQAVAGFECIKTFKSAIQESIEWFLEKEERRIINEQQNLLIESFVEQWTKNQTN
jgi:nucleoside-diphosphate-sugar epimerase